MIKLLLHESKRRVGSPGVFITLGTYFIISHYLGIWSWIITIFDQKKDTEIDAFLHA